jgi:hypothetical protein
MDEYTTKKDLRKFTPKQREDLIEYCIKRAEKRFLIRDDIVSSVSGYSKVKFGIGFYM